MDRGDIVYCRFLNEDELVALPKTFLEEYIKLYRGHSNK